MRMEVRKQYKLEELDDLITVDFIYPSGNRYMAFAMAEQTLGITKPKHLDNLVKLLEGIADVVNKGDANEPS